MAKRVTAADYGRRVEIERSVVEWSEFTEQAAEIIRRIQEPVMAKRVTTEELYRRRVADLEDRIEKARANVEKTQGRLDKAEADNAIDRASEALGMAEEMLDELEKELLDVVTAGEEEGGLSLCQSE